MKENWPRLGTTGPCRPHNVADACAESAEAAADSSFECCYCRATI